jgi:hypothetical protein
MVIGIIIGLVIGCSLGVFVAAMAIGAKSADKQLERNADYLRAYHLKKAKSNHENNYMEATKPHLKPD